MEVRVERVAAETTFPLRWRVLRPHLPRPEQTVLPGERAAGAVHLAALTADGEVVATAVLVRETFACWPERTEAWRLRGMATEERLRSQGIGGRLLRRAIEHVTDAGGGLLWCHARVPAQAFYERAGFTAVGEAWEEPHLGPHVAMWLEVPGAVPDGRADVSWRPG